MHINSYINYIQHKKHHLMKHFTVRVHVSSITDSETCSNLENTGGYLCYFYCMFCLCLQAKDANGVRKASLGFERKGKLQMKGM